MTKRTTAEKLSFISQNLKLLESLEQYGTYYTIIEPYLDKLTTDEFEAALELALTIKERDTKQQSIVSQPKPIKPDRSPKPKPQYSVVRERTTILQEDRDKIDQLRELGYTPVEISRLVNAKSDHWAKNIIYSHSATSPVNELVALRSLNLDNLPAPPAHARLVQKQRRTITLTRHHEAIVPSSLDLDPSPSPDSNSDPARDSDPDPKPEKPA